MNLVRQAMLTSGTIRIVYPPDGACLRVGSACRQYDAQTPASRRRPVVRRCRTQSLDATFLVSVVALLSSPKRINTHRKFPLWLHASGFTAEAFGQAACCLRAAYSDATWARNFCKIGVDCSSDQPSDHRSTPCFLHKASSFRMWGPFSAISSGFIVGKSSSVISPRFH